MTQCNEYYKSVISMNIRKLVESFLSGRCQIPRKAQTKGLNSSSKDKKIFCIGLHKTGTTSLEAALKNHGFLMGNQSAGEDLLEDWAIRDFKRIIDLCHTADAFQDTPFALPYTYQALDMHFSNAKFILTIRNDFEQWYRSITRFHSKLWADGVRVPTVEDLKKAPYRYKGRAYRANRLLFNTSENDLYEKKCLQQYYENHNYAVNKLLSAPTR